VATWSNPVYDRTLADVEYARLQLEKQINNVDYKGCLNANDLTRIENNTRYLADELIKLYYFNSISTRTWSRGNVPNTANITLILGNISKILSAYQKPKNIPTLPTTLLTYEQVNDVEKNLFMIKEMLDNMIASFRQCGTFGCGEG
jgi:hypothetical protein